MVADTDPRHQRQRAGRRQKQVEASAPKSRTILDIARGYVAAGLSVTRVRANGTKAPIDKNWTQFCRRQPTDAELQKWFGSGASVGVGIACGPASGNLAVLDFETAEAFDHWCALVPAEEAAALAACPAVRTPSGGAHVWCRLTESAAGTVLARRPDPENPKKGRVLIEIRGDGNQVLAPGCPPACHPSGKTYEFIRRGWLDGGTHTPVPMDVFTRWCERAVGLNQFTPPAKERFSPAPRPPRDPNHKSPGDDFNHRGTWEETGLFATGWKWNQQLDAERGFMRRPGKSSGTSATLSIVSSRENGWPLFYVFTTNGDLFEANRSYDRFGVFTRLNHGNDFAAAAAALAAKGYGTPLSRRTSTAVARPEARIPRRDAPAEVLSMSATILNYLLERYRPVFRRRNAIHTADGRDVPMNEACAVPDSDLIERLGAATDAPRYTGGGIKRDSLPGAFNRWAKVAWGDLLKSLPDEDDAELGAGAPAAEEFRRLVREALLTQAVLGDVIGTEAVTQTERRSLIGWCERFAKPGQWKSIRSYRCWCKVKELGGGELQLMVAIRHEFFAQVGADRRLREMGATKFGRRAAKYGIGRSTPEERPHGVNAVVLDPAFVASLTANLYDDGPIAVTEG